MRLKLIIFGVFVLCGGLGLMLMTSSKTVAKQLVAKPYVTPWLQSGQLGNQLHEIATTLAYAWDNNVEAIFPELNRNDLNIPINRERIFFRLNRSPLPRPIAHTFDQFTHFEKIEIPKQSDLLLRGYYQTWKYYDHHRDKLVEVFAPSPEELKHLTTKHAALLEHPCTVGVHVRTFNKHWCTLSNPFVDIDYYEKAMDLFPEDALFVVFSDRINWTKHHFQKIKRPMIFIEDQDHIEDFFLMSMLKHNIICNSSFSWWAAYLNPNPHKKVVTPSHFLFPNEYAKVANASLPDWHIIEIPLDHHFPEDMNLYDARSKSIDTQ